jgi:hypothetical protein
MNSVRTTLPSFRTNHPVRDSKKRLPTVALTDNSHNDPNSTLATTCEELFRPGEVGNTALNVSQNKQAAALTKEHDHRAEWAQNSARRRHPRVGEPLEVDQIKALVLRQGGTFFSEGIDEPTQEFEKNPVQDAVPMYQDTSSYELPGTFDLADSGYHSLQLVNIPRMSTTDSIPSLKEGYDKCRVPVHVSPLFTAYESDTEFEHTRERQDSLLSVGKQEDALPLANSWGCRRTQRGPKEKRGTKHKKTSTMVQAHDGPPKDVPGETVRKIGMAAQSATNSSKLSGESWETKWQIWKSTLKSKRNLYTPARMTSLKFNTLVCNPHESNGHFIPLRDKKENNENQQLTRPAHSTIQLSETANDPRGGLLAVKASLLSDILVLPKESKCPRPCRANEPEGGLAVTDDFTNQLELKDSRPDQPCNRSVGYKPLSTCTKAITTDSSSTKDGLCASKVSSRASWDNIHKSVRGTLLSQHSFESLSSRDDERYRPDSSSFEDTLLKSHIYERNYGRPEAQQLDRASDIDPESVQVATPPHESTQLAANSQQSKLVGTNRCISRVHPRNIQISNARSDPALMSCESENISQSPHKQPPEASLTCLSDIATCANDSNGISSCPTHYAAGDQNNATASASSSSRKATGQQSGFKRMRNDSGDPNDGSDETEDDERQNNRRGNQRSPGDLHAKRTRCPFYLRDPYTFAKTSACSSDKGFKHMAALRQHLKRVHTRPLRCYRCQIEVGSESDLVKHLREVRGCLVRDELKDDRISHEVWARIDSKRAGCGRSSVEAKWISLFQAIFPDDKDIPSPCEYCLLII